ncbi:MAG: adenine deaminase [Bacteroidales bacterium]
MESAFIVSGKVVDIFNRRIFNAHVYVSNQKITKIEACDEEFGNYILPGFVDSHVHIESSMMIPSSFARAAVKHGTVATVSDPHEIANVLGIEGVEFMINNSKKVPFKFYFGAPSCVPATPFETSGAVISEKEIQKLLENPDIYYLAEMMNFPGVIHGDKDVLAKLNHATNLNKPIDGHAPGLTGVNLQKYASKNITTDHECTTIEEAIEKINNGMKIQIREGSAAKDFENLFPLIDSYPDKIMFCTDDCHPDDLIKGHINKTVKRAVEKGADLFNVLAATTINPINHYKLNVGLLRIGDPADFIVVKDLTEFDVEKTFINGLLVFENGKVLFPFIDEKPINRFDCNKISENDISVAYNGGKLQIIVAKDGDLITGKSIEDPLVKNGLVISDTARDILKIVVVNRYFSGTPSVGFIKNFKLRKGAMAGSIAHDSHNIIAIGTNDSDIVVAINRLIENKGGIVAFDGREMTDLKLNVAGLMSVEEAEVIAEKYQKVNNMVKEMGSTLTAPFMTMAFMALLVIPELKIGDKGLFDVSKFEFTSLFV